MDPTIAQAFAASVLTATQNATERAASQSIYAQQDNRMITSWAAQIMAQATGPGMDAALQAASHVPNVQPYTVPGFVPNPAYGPVTAQQGAGS